MYFKSFINKNKKMKCPHCLKEFRNDLQKDNLIKRREFILKNISEEITFSKLYKGLRQQGYRYRRQTFDKDINILHEQNLLTIDKTLTNKYYIVPI